MSCFHALEQAVATVATRTTVDDAEPCEGGACPPGADKPQIDLSEFLQQIGVLNNTDDDGIRATAKARFHGDAAEAGCFGEFDWDALAADLNDIAGAGVHGGVNGGFQMDDLREHEVEQFGTCLPIPVWDVQ
ncbi:Dehydration-responsive element-binding protein 2E [Zea mays]|uniref:Dehydration-responsive element-binding protein 2E n=1 Tax=Zea mays TaxID=4577 RepID=A0A3L6DFY8_MAIZE|nr:Dehydration-responsive element-binding protein 2E [Zea mays]